MTIREAGRLLRSWQVSCEELVEQAFESARQYAHLNAFITLTEAAALERARLLDRELREGKDRGPLHGIPVAFKDLFYTKGVRTTCGSKIFADFVPDHDAAVVERMAAAGAVSIGKLNMHELAYGITSNNPHFGPVRNPVNPERIPGGSSGGSGALVAAGVVFCGMGSDTGGSIRIPAAFCGTFGLKPTFGRVSRAGTFPLGLTLDHMGPLTRTAEDAAIVLEAISGPDSRDESTRDKPLERYTTARDLNGVRIGVPVNFYGDRLNDDVRRVWQKVANGAREVRVPDPAELNVIARTILLAEASAVLAPHHGRREELGEDVLALLDQGRLLPAIHYVNAQRVRRQMMREWARVFRDVDVLVTPTTPMAAPAIGARTVSLGGVDEDTRLAATKFVRGINALGLPAVSIPCGHSADGMPIGMQLVAKPWAEGLLLRVASVLEATHAGV